MIIERDKKGRTIRTAGNNTNINGTAGRPEIVTPAIVSKLEQGFAMSLNDQEACLFADISPASLYRYIEKNPKFGEKKEILKKKPNIKAKMNWLKKLNEEDYVASKDWLERRSKDEFSLKSDIINVDVNTTYNTVDFTDKKTEELQEILMKKLAL